MFLSRKIFFFLLAGCSLLSCRPDKGPGPGKSRSQMLTEAGWLLIEAYSNTQKDTINDTRDIYAEMQDCEKDNVTYFADDHKITIHSIGIKCYDTEPEKITPKEWVLISNSELELTDILQKRTYTAVIFELSEELLHYRVTGTKPDGTYFEETYKYKKVK